MKKKILVVIAVLALLICSFVYKSTMAHPNLESAIGLTTDDGLSSFSIDSDGSAIRVSIRLQHPITKETFPQTLNRITEAAKDTYGEDRFPSLRVTLAPDNNSSIEYTSNGLKDGEISCDYEKYDDNDIADFQGVVHSDLDLFYDFLSEIEHSSFSVKYTLPSGFLIFQPDADGIGTVTDMRLNNYHKFLFRSWEDFDAYSWEIHIPTNGEKNALVSAMNYLNVAAFSYKRLIEQLEYEQYTHEEAVYAADNCGTDWNEQAAMSAKSYLEISSFSRTRLIEQLEYEGFTHAQAVYGVEQNGY